MRVLTAEELDWVVGGWWEPGTKPPGVPEVPGGKPPRETPELPGDTLEMPDWLERAWDRWFGDPNEAWREDCLASGGSPSEIEADSWFRLFGLNVTARICSRD